MRITSDRLGTWTSSKRDVITFSEGLIGFESLQRWALAREGNLYWLQSVDDSSISLPAICPFLVLPQLSFSFNRGEVFTEASKLAEKPVILAIVQFDDHQWLLNLRAPILIALQKQWGKQLITTDVQPLRFVLPCIGDKLRKSA